MKSKNFWLAIISTFVFPTTFSNINTVSASTISEAPHKPEETEIISTEYFSPSEYSEFSIVPFADDPGVGSTKISDSLSTLNALRDQKRRSFTSMDTFKAASIEIASRLPVVGKWVETGNTIWVHLKNVTRDVGSGIGKDVKVSTSYSDR